MEIKTDVKPSCQYVDLRHVDECTNHKIKSEIILDLNNAICEIYVDYVVAPF